MAFMKALFATLAVAAAQGPPTIEKIAIWGQITPNPNVDFPAPLKEFLELTLPDLLAGIPDIAPYKALVNLSKVTVGINDQGKVSLGLPYADDALAGLGAMPEVKGFLESVLAVLKELLSLFIDDIDQFTIADLQLSKFMFADTPTPVLIEQTRVVINATMGANGMNATAVAPKAKMWLDQALKAYIPSFLQDIQAFKDAIDAVNTATIATKDSAVLLTMQSPVPTVLAATLQSLVVESTMLQDVLREVTGNSELEIYVPNPVTPPPPATTTPAPPPGNPNSNPNTSGAGVLVTGVAAFVLALL